MKDNIKRHLKNLMIIAFISILLEVLLLGYYFCINKLYTKRHLISNEPIEIDIQSLQLSEPDEWGYVYLHYNNKIENVYNVELIMKETTNDKYILKPCINFIVIQAGINILMNISLFPIVGITYPLLSYGGSSCISILLLIGIIYNMDNMDYSYNHHSNYNRKKV